MTERPVLGAGRVDLTQCAAEPIHIPGAIQPHGALLVLHGDALVIVQASLNTSDVLGAAHATLIQRSLGDVFGDAVVAQVRAALARYHRLPDVAAGFRWVVPERGISVAAHVHAVGALLILEVETESAVTVAPLDEAVEPATAFRMVRMQETLTGKLQVAAEWIRHITGFDRVMVYRFHEDWHGEVLAESRDDALEPFLGLHYPASDIPAQARRLYVTSPTRTIVDVRYDAVPVLPVLNPITQAPLDLSGSTLRAVSPIHLEYLHNMGVGATLVVSVVCNGELWGLIACHHRTPHRIAPAIRQVTEWMAQDLSSQISLVRERETRLVSAGLRDARDRIVHAMRGGVRLATLVQGEALASILTAVAADGVAVVRGTEVVTGGRAPPADRIVALVRALAPHHPVTHYAPFVTDCLSDVLPGTEDLADCAAGIGMFPFDAAESLHLLWFRPEQLQSVHWGGNPDKSVTVSASGRLSPRRSFAVWTENMHRRCRPWRAEELAAARELGAMIDIELRQIAEEATQATEALLRDATDSLTAHIAVLDRDGRVVTVNRAWRDFAEQTTGAMASLPGADFLAACHASADDAPDAAQAAHGVDDVLARRRETFSLEYRSGLAAEARWFLLRAFPLSGAHVGAVVACEDITVTKAAERRLRESEARFRTLFESESAMMLLLDPATNRFIDVNPAAVHFYGYSRAAFRAMSLSDVLRTPGDLVNEHVVVAQTQPRHEWRSVHWLADGTARDVSVSAAPVRLDNQPVLFAVVHDITARVMLEGDLARKQTQLEEWNHTLAERVEGAIAELREKDQLLLTQSRQAAMGEMIANIAHQWRQPLNAMALLFANLADAEQHQALDTASVNQAVATGQALVQRMSSTITDFRDFFRPDKARVAFSLRMQIEQTAALADASFRHASITLYRDIPHDAAVVGLPNEFSQVLLNLLINAKEAIEAHRASTETVGEADIVVVSIRVRDEQAVVEVRDTAGGIPSEVLPHVFDPFYTTRERGTGIGLYMSRMIVERSLLGTITARNDGGGAVLTITCPLAPSVAA